MLFLVAKPNEYIVKTGLLIADAHVSKKCLIFPGQRAYTISMTPINYTLSLHAMTIEKLECCCS
jgi:flotillin